MDNKDSLLNNKSKPLNKESLSHQTKTKATEQGVLVTRQKQKPPNKES